MLRGILSAAAAACLGALASAAPAAADTVLNRGHLNQYCAATHGPRGVQSTGERVGYNRFGQAEALCRLVGVPFGYTLNNESVEAVCRFVGESGRFNRSGGGVNCLSAPSTGVFYPGPIWRNPIILGRPCVRTPTGFRCR